MLKPVAFTVLGKWTPLSYRFEVVEIAFYQRLVAFGERHGPDNNAAIYRAEEFLEAWSLRLTERGWQWMFPLIERLGSGDDPMEVEANALFEYAQLHDGAMPPIHHWEIDPDRWRR